MAGEFELYSSGPEGDYFQGNADYSMLGQSVPVGERVPVDQIEECLKATTPSKPFPSKTFKDAFVGKSSNNAGFLTAILRSEGLLGAAPEAETQHVIVSSLDAWKSKVLTEPGILIAFPANGNAKTTPDAGPAPDNAKTLTLPRKKSA
jgi:hypothetical protein